MKPTCLECNQEHEHRPACQCMGAQEAMPQRSICNDCCSCGAAVEPTPEPPFDFISELIYGTIGDLPGVNVVRSETYPASSTYELTIELDGRTLHISVKEVPK